MVRGGVREGNGKGRSKGGNGKGRSKKREW